MKVIEYLEKTFDPKNENKLRQPLTCMDGFWIDVQGGTRFHYCQPREHVNKYEKVELSCEPDSLIADYQDGEIGIYKYVPIETVEQLAEKHGGIRE